MSTFTMYPSTEPDNQAAQSTRVDPVHPAVHFGATAQLQQDNNTAEGQARETNQDDGIESIMFDAVGNRNQAFEDMTEDNLREAIANLFGYARVGNGLGYMSPVQQAAQQAYAHFHAVSSKKGTGLQNAT
ncbi:unnamed protein product [Cyclocybe aegerita]|uniref:Uncharacterized protein n=1 Tax=Cyclocybe aegerita TaxID=1973307 RepID=A0A8S0W5Y8_CYCAE|nr:unnamed protein product [Cyclocybe aegerita]